MHGAYLATILANDRGRLAIIRQMIFIASFCSYEFVCITGAVADPVDQYDLPSSE